MGAFARILESQKFGSLVLTKGQQTAVDMIRSVASAKALGALSNVICSVKGYAGTGKTTLLKAITQVVSRMLVLTPTGKAALRVRESTGLHAGTIHRFLYDPDIDSKGDLRGFFKKPIHSFDIAPDELIVVDEASMMNRDMWNDLWDVCKAKHLDVLLVGDPFQLPPVSVSGPPFSVFSRAFEEDYNVISVELTEILRQEESNPIVKASMRLRAGEGINALSDLQWVSKDEASPPKDGVIVCRTNAMRHALNNGIRSSFGRQGILQAGEPVLVTKNNYLLNLFNGETFVFPGWKHVRKHKELHFGVFASAEGEAVACIEQISGNDLSPGQYEYKGRQYLYASGYIRTDPDEDFRGLFNSTKSRNDNDKRCVFVHLNYAYALTAHKCQGSQWPEVLVVLEKNTYPESEDGRRWLYTAITRAEDNAKIVDLRDMLLT